MRRKYPKDEAIKRLVCEQVRPELNNKLSLLGLYAGDHVIIHPATPDKKFPYTLARLAFMYIIKGGLGEFEAHFKLLDPENKPANEVKLNPINLKLNGTSGIVVQLNNVQFNSVGDYTAVLHLGNKKYNFPIVISVDSTAASK